MIIQNRKFLLIISICIIFIVTLTVSFCLLSQNTITSNNSETTSVLIEVQIMEMWLKRGH